MHRLRSHFRFLIAILICAVPLAGCLSRPTAPVQPAPNVTRVGTSSAYSSPTPSPSQTALPASTATLKPTRQPQETPTPANLIPQVTDFNPNVPFILYAPKAGHKEKSTYQLPAADNQQRLYRIAADGSGWGKISLPMGAYIFDLDRSVSPDGRWLVYYTGSAGNADPQDNGPFDLALNLLDLQTGQLHQSIQLLSPDFPNNFSKLADMLFPGGIPDWPWLDEGATGSSYEWQLFLNGIFTKDWSPDGGRLAFAGEMDGPSSDLYLYDVAKRSVSRLTDGYGQVQWIRYSPDGKWIAHRSTTEEGPGVVDQDIYFAAADGSSVRDLPTSEETFWGNHFAGWIEPSSALIYSLRNGSGSSGLFEIRLSDGQIIPLWKDIFTVYAIDPDAKLLAVSQLSSFGDFTATPPPLHGVYLSNLVTGSPPQRLEEFSADYPPPGLIPWDSAVYRFVALTDDPLSGIRADGTVEPLRKNPCHHAWTSPDERWLFLCSDQGSNMVDLVSPEGQIVQTFEYLQVENRIWSPDSQWFLVQQENGLWVDHPGDGERTIVLNWPDYRSDDPWLAVIQWDNVITIAPKK